MARSSSHGVVRRQSGRGIQNPQRQGDDRRVVLFQHVGQRRQLPAREADGTVVLTVAVAHLGHAAPRPRATTAVLTSMESDMGKFGGLGDTR